MNFKDAYKAMLNGSKIKRESLQIQETQVKIEYFCMVVTKYFSGDDMIKQEAPFLVCKDANGMTQRVSDPSIITHFLSDDEDWEEYVAPEAKVIDIEDAVVEPVVE